MYCIDFGGPKNQTFGNIIIFIIISGFGIYGAAVVPDSRVGNTWQRLTLVLHEFLSNGLTPSTTANFNPYVTNGITRRGRMTRKKEKG